MRPLDFTSDKEFLESELKNLKGVTLYLLSTGRNAWHSTWSERYQRDGALFTSFEEAKNAAENSRKKGTTFEIEQLPGLAFYSLIGVLALVEFHSKQPFSKLRIAEIGKLIQIGTPLSTAASPFLKASNTFWEKPFPSESSFVNIRTDLTKNFESLQEAIYQKKWRSIATGSNNYLGWRERGEPEETPITKVLANFATQNYFENWEALEKELDGARSIAFEKQKKDDEAETRLSEAITLLSSLLEQFSDTDQEKDS